MKRSLFTGKKKKSRKPPHYRVRSATLASTSHKDISAMERHHKLLKMVKQLGHDMTVFHLRWMPGDYLDQDILESVPMFWFKKFAWSRDDVEQLFDAGQITMNEDVKQEITSVYGKRKKKKYKKRDSLVPSATFYPPSSSNQSLHTNGNAKTEQNYRRTRRLLKKVKAVPSRVRALDNKSELNIQSSGYPDTQFLHRTSAALFESKEDVYDAVMRHPIAVTNESIDAYDTNNSMPRGITQYASDNENMNSAMASDNEHEMNSPNNTHVMSDQSDELSELPTFTHTKSNTITTPFGEMDTNTMVDLRKKHKRTSITLRKQSLISSISDEIVWHKLAIVSERGDTMSQRQFDIELQNNDILADPDISKELFKVIQGIDPISKKKFKKEDIRRICKELDEIPLVDQIQSSDIDGDIEMKRKIILKKVFYHMVRGDAFDVNDYLVIRLTTSQLNDPEHILVQIGSRTCEWRVRLQVLEWICENLEDETSALIGLTSDKLIGSFLLGWICQCLDERSNLSKAALEMFPNVFSIAMTQNGESFQHLNDILSSLFLVLRNKRSKDLQETANECVVSCIDMIMDWHEHGCLDNEVLLEIANIFRDNTIQKEMKHDKVRERCVAYFGFIVFGIEGPTTTDVLLQNDDSNTSGADGGGGSSMLAVTNTTGHTQAKSSGYLEQMDGDVEEKWVAKPRPSFVGNANALKIAKKMKRKYLLDKTEHSQFIGYMQDALVNGCNDKSGETRNTTFKLLAKLMHEDKTMLIGNDGDGDGGGDDNGKIFDIDPLTMSKFNKWISRNMKSKNKRKKSKKRIKIKRPNHRKKNSITLTVGAHND